MAQTIEFSSLPEYKSPINDFRDQEKPAVREIAARTQVQIKKFKECPNCSESMFNNLEIVPFTTWVEFVCHNCQAHGEVNI